MFPRQRKGNRRPSRCLVRQPAMRILALGSTAVFVAATFSEVIAHQSPGVDMRAFPFPDHLTPEIDGDLTDWEIVDPGFCVSTDQFTDLVSGAAPDPTDFRTTLCVGWNDALNQLYISALVADDVHQVDRPEGTPPALIFQDDDFEVFLDADHSGGQFADFSDLSEEEQLRLNGTEANHFILSGPPPPNGDFFVNFSAAGWYSDPDGEFTKASVVVVSPGVVAYELALTPFDRIDVGASFLSVAHDLRAGEVLGFNVEFNDFDTHPELYEAKWSLSGGQNSFRLSERFADLELAEFSDSDAGTETAIVDKSWGQIKTSIPP